MADNIDVTPGVGKTVRSEEIGGIQYQLVKFIDGLAGSVVRIYAGIGAMANALRVVPANDITRGTYIGDSPPGGIVIAQTPTISAGAYSALDAVGGKLTFANAAPVANGKGVINSVTIIDDDKESAALELWLFSQDFTNTADNAAFDPSDADLENCIGVIEISTAHYKTANDNGVATVPYVGIEFQCTNGGTSIYGQLKCTATPSYTATTDLTVKLGIGHIG